jgi:hypothetical protein
VYRSVGPTILVANGTPHTSLLIVKEYFNSWYLVNTASVPVVLSIYIPSQIEPSFFSKRCRCWFKSTVIYCSQKPVTELHFHNYLLHLLEPVLFYTVLVSVAFCLVYLLSIKGVGQLLPSYLALVLQYGSKLFFYFLAKILGIN